MQKDTMFDSLLERFSEAMNKYDLDYLVACFSNDAEFTNVQGKRSKGRTAIREAHEPLFKRQQTLGVPSFYGSTFKQEVISIKFVKEDVAAVDIKWAQDGVKGPDGQVWPLRKGLINAIAVKEAQDWYFEIFHNMLLPG